MLLDPPPKRAELERRRDAYLRHLDGRIAAQQAILDRLIAHRDEMAGVEFEETA